MAAGAWLVALTGCDLQGRDPDQLLITLATDAPVPRFGDRVMIELLHGGEVCEGCSRLVAASELADLPVSFGVGATELTVEAPLFVRARLYRAADAEIGLPPADGAVIDALAKLLRPTGITRVELDLRVDCMGVPADVPSGRTCDPTSRALVPAPTLQPLPPDSEPLASGSWPPAARQECSGEPPAGMVCIPGGAFLLGGRSTNALTGPPLLPRPERVVQVSPFAIDTEEMTVGVARQLFLEGKVPDQPTPKAGTLKDGQFACVYLGVGEETNDALPVNCISLPLAAAICDALGKRLPTEAEWEWAAGNLEAETKFSWGFQTDECKRAVIGTGRGLQEGIADDNWPEFDYCRHFDTNLPWGPVAGGNPLDVTQLGVHDMSGNLSEWVVDTFASYDAPCWHQATVPLVDPHCDGTPEPLYMFANRGGSWAFPIAQAQVVSRNASPSASSDVTIGVRCVKSM